MWMYEHMITYFCYKLGKMSYLESVKTCLQKGGYIRISSSNLHKKVAFIQIKLQLGAFLI